MKTGYLIFYAESISYGLYRLLSECRNYCDKLIIGVPDDELYMRMYDAKPIPSSDEVADFLGHIDLVDNVISVDVEHLGFRYIWDALHFDVCFCGTEYGTQYSDDKAWLAEQGVDLISLVPDRYEEHTGIDSLRRSLSILSVDHTIVLYGTGKYFDIYMSQYGEEFPPAYAVDSDHSKSGTNKSGIDIKSPDVLRNDKDVAVILCMRDYKSALDDVKELGVAEYRTLLSLNVLADYQEYSIIWNREQTYLKHAHFLLRILMKEIDRVCTEHQIRYFVISGSLIGVIRHHGMIPWDDDIDIAMPRTDYEKFIQVVKKEWSSDSDFELLDYFDIGDNVFYDFMTRVIYKAESIPLGLFEKAGNKARQDIKDKMVIDIYLLDDAIPGLKHKWNTFCMQVDYVLAMGHRGYVDYNDYERLGKIKLAILKLINKAGKIIPLKMIFGSYEKHRKYAFGKKKADHYFESGGVVAYMPWTYNKSLYGDGCRLPMYDMNVMVPSDYDGLLKAKGYGDYMQLPAVNNRIPAHMKGRCRIIW